MENVTAIGGYSGHGVMLSNYCGKLYADMVLGGSDDLEELRLIDVPSFPGGQRFRAPLLFLALTWFALRDKLYVQLRWKQGAADTFREETPIAQHAPIPISPRVWRF